MAARRLLILMLVLLATSTLAATLVPQPVEQEETTTGTTSPRTSPSPRGGELVRARFSLGARGPQGVTLPLGDQLALTVTSDEPAQIAIPKLGLLEDALPLSPARFDILPTSRGRYEVRRVEPDGLVGVVRVTDRGERGRRGAD